MFVLIVIIVIAGIFDPWETVGGAQDETRKFAGVQRPWRDH